MHLAKNRQHASNNENEEDVFEANIAVMSHNDLSDSKLLAQNVGATVLDSSCSRSVCGSTWYNCYLDTLPGQKKHESRVDRW